ncbi:hypothetical protein BD31_I0801 [Candidatus Nitrosopumilus salaria BD31]|uniref:Uncharacterized protein n=1 Tax=Candidatus Nitrosopumilus salarius BD31 TaxID=859350 RepID=I3CZY2_9ARCH|nr:hypothetical protein [Candidatus Nitrosopumilus salaria]EIJ65025.1 hypothetical protein BD31_I0801 [Candidatus Nitrosopumilus salaria BD31]
MIYPKWYEKFGKWIQKRDRIIQKGQRSHLLISHFLDGFEIYESEFYYNCDLTKRDIREILGILNHFRQECIWNYKFSHDPELKWYCSDDFVEHLQTLDVVTSYLTFAEINQIFY